MYVHPHVRRCKRQSNELLHALSRLLITCLIQSSSPDLVHRAAALATGCQVSIEYGWGSTFDLRQNRALGMPLHQGYRTNGVIKKDIQVVKLQTLF